MSQPTEEETEDFLLSCRYGEVDEVKAFAEKYGWDTVSEARDERGNTALHMCCGNGHLDVLELLIPHLSPTLVSRKNENGSSPLHWAILNNHIKIVKALVELPETQGGGLELLQQTNAAGRDAIQEAVFAGEGREEVAGWIEGYLFKLEGGDEGAEADGKSSKTELVNGQDKELVEKMDNLGKS